MAAFQRKKSNQGYHVLPWINSMQYICSLKDRLLIDFSGWENFVSFPFLRKTTFVVRWFLLVVAGSVFFPSISLYSFDLFVENSFQWSYFLRYYNRSVNRYLQIGQVKETKDERFHSRWRLENDILIGQKYKMPLGRSVWWNSLDSWERRGKPVA